MGAFHHATRPLRMDFVRDFVGGSCEGGNALSRFVGTAEKAGAQRDMWQREFLNQEGPSAFSDAHLRGRVPLPSMDANNFLFPQDPRTTQFPQANRIDQFKEFEDVWDALPQGMTDWLLMCCGSSGCLWLKTKSNMAIPSCSSRIQL